MVDPNEQSASASVVELAIARFRKQRDDAEEHRGEMSDQLWQAHHDLMIEEEKVAALEERVRRLLADNQALKVLLGEAEDGLKVRTDDWIAAQQDRDHADETVKAYAERSNYAARVLKAARRIDGIAENVFCEGFCDEMGCRGHAPSPEVAELRDALADYDAYLERLDKGDD